MHQVFGSGQGVGVPQAQRLEPTDESVLPPARPP